jgi:hypothetical protein
MVPRLLCWGGLALAPLLLAQQSDMRKPKYELMAKRIVGLEYPWFARFGVIQGVVEVLATISSDGSVQSVRALSGPSPLVVAAKESVSKWSFTGCPSGSDKCEIKIVFSFVLRGSCDAASHCPSEFELDLPDRVKVSAKSFKAVVN